MGKALKSNILRFEDRCLRNMAGVRRVASELHIDFLRRGATAIKVVKRSAHYSFLWATVNRRVLAWAGQLARSDVACCPAAGALASRAAGAPRDHGFHDGGGGAWLWGASSAGTASVRRPP